MNRLEKKCVLGATTMHALLLLALLVGPAFFTKKEEPLDLVQITFVPAILTDEKTSGGGSPRAGDNAPQPPPPQPPQPPPQPVVKQPEQPPTPEPPVQPERPTPPKVTDRDSDAPVVPKTPPKKHVVAVSDTRVKLTGKKPTTSNPNTTTSKNNSTTSANSELASALKSANQRIGAGLSSGTKVNVPDGPGGGGASYANYAQEIQRRYKVAYDRALQAAGDIAEGQPQVETAIVIMSDGNIVATSIVKPSGNTALDNLVRRVLDSIHEVPPFPAGAKDSRRTFNIIFDLKPKINLG